MSDDSWPISKLYKTFNLESSFIHSTWGKRNLNAGWDDPPAPTFYFVLPLIVVLDKAYFASEYNFPCSYFSD